MRQRIHSVDGINMHQLHPQLNQASSSRPWTADESRSSTLKSISRLFPPTPNESVEDLQHQLELEPGQIEAGRISFVATSSPAAPPQDGGVWAWLFLASCFVVEALVWGFPFSFGVFQDYYSTTEPFMSEYSGIAIIGTTATGIMYAAGALLFFVFNKWPRFARISTICGLPIMAVGLLLASNATRVWHLVLTQGVVYACGGSVLYYAIILYMDEWFDKRKGLAFGVMWAGTGVGGLIIPFIMQSLLDGYGLKTALRVWAIVLCIFAIPLMFFLRPRLPASRSRLPPHATSFWSTSTFWLLQLANIVQSMGFFLPGIYLPSFARSLDLPDWAGTLLVSLINASGVVSAVWIGWMTDYYDVSTIIAISTLGGGLSVLLFWGFATNLAHLAIFSLFYGLFSGGFTSTYTGMIKEMKKRDERTNTGLLVGVLSAGRGIGALVSGPVSEKLLEPHALEAVTQGYGSGYTGLIILTGTTGILASLTFVAKKLGWI